MDKKAAAILHQLRLRSTQHRGLPPAVRVSTQKHPPAAQFPQSRNCIPEPLTIALSIPRPRRTIRPVLPKRKIAAQHSQSSAGECPSHSQSRAENWNLIRRHAPAPAHCPTADVRDDAEIREPADRAMHHEMPGRPRRWSLQFRQLNFLQHFKHFDDPNLIPQLRPAALNFRVLVRRPACLLRFPVAQKHILGTVFVEKSRLKPAAERTFNSTPWSRESPVRGRAEARRWLRIRRSLVHKRCRTAISNWHLAKCQLLIAKCYFFRRRFGRKFPALPRRSPGAGA